MKSQLQKLNSENERKLKVLMELYSEIEILKEKKLLLDQEIIEIIKNKDVLNRKISKCKNI